MYAPFHIFQSLWWANFGPQTVCLTLPDLKNAEKINTEWSSSDTVLKQIWLCKSIKFQAIVIAGFSKKNTSVSTTLLHIFKACG